MEFKDIDITQQHTLKVAKSKHTADEIDSSLGRIVDGDVDRALDGALEAAESAQGSADKAAQAEQVVRAAAGQELERQSAEAARSSAETSRADEERKRAAKEAGRVEAESLRTTAETARQTAEQDRVSTEQGRAGTEGVRVQREAERVASEAERVLNENARLGAEADRLAAEEARALTNGRMQVWEAYDAGKTYQPLNKVSHDGRSYVCQRACRGVTPGGGDGPWLLIADRGDDGAVIDLETGVFAMSVSTDGHLMVSVSTAQTAPPLSIDPETGHLIYTID